VKKGERGETSTGEGFTKNEASDPESFSRGWLQTPGKGGRPGPGCVHRFGFLRETGIARLAPFLKTSETTRYSKPSRVIERLAKRGGGLPLGKGFPTEEERGKRTRETLFGRWNVRHWNFSQI